MIRCPECSTEVQPDWDWCHACGWDPEGLRPAAGAPAAPPPPPPPPTGRRSTSAADRPAPSRTGAAPPLAPGIAAGPGSAHAGYGAAPLPPTAPRRAGTSTGTSVAIVLLGVGGGFVALVVVLVLAVTFLGTAAESPRFSSIEGAITAPEDPPPMGALGDGGGVTDADGVPVGAEWVRFTAADGSYSIDFPVQPAVQVLPFNEPTMSRAESVSATVGSTGYGILLFEYKPEFPIQNPPAALRFTTDEILPTLGMTITDTVPGTYAYATSLSFTGRVPESGESIEGVAFITGQRLYVIASTSGPGATADAERFLGSLTLG
jgi:hypothetical protein